MKNILKKLILILPLFMFTSGCGINELNVDEVVEQFFWSYQNLDEMATGQFTIQLLVGEELKDSEKEIYTEAMYRQYRNLSYTVKDVNKYSNTAVVSVMITVYDFNNTFELVDEYVKEYPAEFYDGNGIFSQSDFNRYKYLRMNEEDERITYDFTLDLTETSEGWEITPISLETLAKIQGIYEKKEVPEEPEE